MSGGHVSLPALDIEREQKEIDVLIASLQQYKPAGRRIKEQTPTTSTSTTPKSVPSKPGRGRPPKNREVTSSPAVAAEETVCAAGFELVIECLNRLNSQNQKLFNRVSELDNLVKEQNKTIESLQTRSEPNSESVQAVNGGSSPASDIELLTTVVKRVEKIEDNINSHLLICRGPAVTAKIAASTRNGTVDLERVKAEICADVCEGTVSQISVSALGISIYGKSKKLLKIQCASINVRNHLLQQARSRKPTGIYITEFLSPDRIKLYHRLNDLKREFPRKVKAVYIRKGEVFCKTEPEGDVIRITEFACIDDLRRQLADRGESANHLDGADRPDGANRPVSADRPAGEDRLEGADCPEGVDRRESRGRHDSIGSE